MLKNFIFHEQNEVNNRLNWRIRDRGKEAGVIFFCLGDMEIEEVKTKEMVEGFYLEKICEYSHLQLT